MDTPFTGSQCNPEMSNIERYYSSKKQPLFSSTTDIRTASNDCCVDTDNTTTSNTCYIQRHQVITLNIATGTDTASSDSLQLVPHKAATKLIRTKYISREICGRLNHESESEAILPAVVTSCGAKLTIKV